ncbi:MAG: MarR family winged helix-turn-helix transcriptional regulator [Nocardioidaceae bacterium]|nr:MarR family winged helix-turn-helix transcriptional regulator [Nocardioidaceae bacterium]
MSTTPPWLDETEANAWRGFLSVHAQMTARLHRDLQASSGLSIADYEILVVLTDADVPDQSVRMFELGEQVQWEKSRVSKQVSRMEARGLVARRDCPDDRRGAFVELTDAGRAAIEAAAPTHVALVRQLFLDPLSREQVEALGAITQAVTARLSI